MFLYCQSVEEPLRPAWGKGPGNSISDLRILHATHNISGALRANKEGIFRYKYSKSLYTETV